jgi:ACS family hexuronate transporter-like MFS transporter
MIGGGRATTAGVMPERTYIHNLRWYIILLFFFATIISYVDRQALSVNAPHLRRDLGLSATQYSYLVTAFLVAYTIGPVLAGRLIDSIGTRLGMTCAIVWWSVAASLHAFGSSLAVFLVLRFCLGLGEAGTLPSTIKAVSEWFPIRDRSMATSIFSAGTAIGAVVAVPIVAFATASLGWRTSFLVTGLLGFLWLIPWLLLYGRPEDHPRLSPEERSRILTERVTLLHAAAVVARGAAPSKIVGRDPRPFHGGSGLAVLSVLAAFSDLPRSQWVALSCTPSGRNDGQGRIR